MRVGLIALRVRDLQRHGEGLSHDRGHTPVSLGELGRLLFSGSDCDLVKGLHCLSVVRSLFVVKIDRVSASDHKHHCCYGQNDHDRCDPE